MWFGSHYTAKPGRDNRGRAASPPFTSAVASRCGRLGGDLKMGVYVDDLHDHGWHRGPSCHLIADSVEELIEFAVSIGLRAEWFQPKSSPHFDLTAEARAVAVRHGAVELSRRGLVTKLRELRARTKNAQRIGRT
ncbi:MAG: DUF4031 domain-containing protein [Pyrinomonadaceae bacterium]